MMDCKGVCMFISHLRLLHHYILTEFSLRPVHPNMLLRRLS